MQMPAFGGKLPLELAQYDGSWGIVTELLVQFSGIHFATDAPQQICRPDTRLWHDRRRCPHEVIFSGRLHEDRSINVGSCRHKVRSHIKEH